MRFLIDADLPRMLVELCREHGHDADDVRDIGLGAAPDSRIAAHAQVTGACLVTGDFGFADIRNYPPDRYHGIVVLEVPHTTTTPTILALMEGLLRTPEVLHNLPGRLAIVDSLRIRCRPPIDPTPPT